MLRAAPATALTATVSPTSRDLQTTGLSAVTSESLSITALFNLTDSHCVGFCLPVLFRLLEGKVRVMAAALEL